MFIGHSSFMSNYDVIWYGIKLDKPYGDNNGNFYGRKFFQCKDKHGIFVKKDEFTVIKVSLQLLYIRNYTCAMCATVPQYFYCS